jgi:hypothetical protein
MVASPTGCSLILVSSDENVKFGYPVYIRIALKDSIRKQELRYPREKGSRKRSVIPGLFFEERGGIDLKVWTGYRVIFPVGGTIRLFFQSFTPKTVICDCT